MTIPIVINFGGGPPEVYPFNLTNTNKTNIYEPDQTERGTGHVSHVRVVNEHSSAVELTLYYRKSGTDYVIANESVAALSWKDIPIGWTIRHPNVLKAEAGVANHLTVTAVIVRDISATLSA